MLPLGAVKELASRSAMKISPLQWIFRLMDEFSFLWLPFGHQGCAQAQIWQWGHRQPFLFPVHVRVNNGAGRDVRPQ
jgi:hypothetical protein